MYWEMRKKKEKNICICILGVFPVAEMKKKMCEKRKKKKRCRNWIGLGYCPTMSQYNGNCIVTQQVLGVLFGLGEGHDTIGLYRD